MSNNTVGLSYAHYPEAPGAGYKGFYEHFESVIWTDIIKKVVQTKGYKVVIPPAGKLKDKVSWLNNANCTLAVELHFNGSNNPEVSGCETLYYPGSVEGKKLARRVHSEYAREMGNKDRGMKEGWYKMDRPGITDYKGDIDGDEKIDYFLAKTNCPAIIIEPEFISQVLRITSSRDKVASAIGLGLIEYLLQRPI